MELSSEFYSWLETRKLEAVDKIFLTDVANKMRDLESQSKYKSLNRKRDQMRRAVEDAINEADIYFKCSGFQNENNSDLSLEEWSLEDADAVVNNILGIIADYISEVL